MRVFLVIACSLLASSNLGASESPKGWKIVSDSRFCYAESSAGDGFTLTIHPRNNVLEFLDDDAFGRLEVDQEYSAVLKIDGKTWSGTAEFTDLSLAIYVPQDFVEALRGGRVLSGSVNDTALKEYSLTGSGEALGALDACVKGLQ